MVPETVARGTLLPNILVSLTREIAQIERCSTVFAPHGSHLPAFLAYAKLRMHERGASFRLRKSRISYMDRAEQKSALYEFVDK